MRAICASISNDLISCDKDPLASSKPAGCPPAVLSKLPVSIRPYRSTPPTLGMRSDSATSQEVAQSQTMPSVALIKDIWPPNPEPPCTSSLPRRNSSPGPHLMSNALPRRKNNLTSQAPAQPNPVFGTYTRPGAGFRDEQVDTRRYAVFMEDVDGLALRHILPPTGQDTPQSHLPILKSGLPETQKPDPGLEMSVSSVAGSSGADDSKTIMHNMTATLICHKGSDYNALVFSAKIDAMYGVYKRQDFFQFYGPEAEDALQKTVVRTLETYDKDWAIQFLRCKNPKRTAIFNILLAQRLAENNHRFVVATYFVDQQEVESSCLDTVRGAIIPTIAYQICKTLLEMRAGLPVCQGVVNKPPATQIEELIVKLLRRAEGSLPPRTRKEIVVIIDRIDRVGVEWEGNLLELFAEHIEKGSLSSVKIVVTASRCLTYRTASIRKFTAAGKSILLS